MSLLTQIFLNAVYLKHGFLSLHLWNKKREIKIARCNWNTRTHFLYSTYNCKEEFLYIQFFSYLECCFIYLLCRNCEKEHVKENTFCAGLKSFKILPIEPLAVDSVKIGESQGSVALKQEYKNIKLYGLTKNLDIKNYK